MIGYCTNVHSGETLEEVVANLQNYSCVIQQQVGTPIGIGIWLANECICESTASRLKDCLEEHNLLVRSINGFPFGNFHRGVVGRDVYKPTWCDERRLLYTTQLATLLVELLPANTSGSISTLPLGWGKDWDGDERAASMLTQCVDFLEDLEQSSGKCIHLDIEPEPGCRLQSADDLAKYIQSQFGDDQRIRRYIRVCYDTCHAAVMWENPLDSIELYMQAGLEIGKVQLSSAIEVDFDSLSKERKSQAITALQTLAEPRYLHQTTVVKDGKMSFYDNLTAASLSHPTGHWRGHIHVPIHRETIGPLGTTQQDLIHTIDVLPNSIDTQWEVETYTWDVMPKVYQENELIHSISSEICWAEKQMQQAKKI